MFWRNLWTSGSPADINNGTDINNARNNFKSIHIDIFYYWQVWTVKPLYKLLYCTRKEWYNVWTVDGKIKVDTQWRECWRTGLLRNE